MMSFHIKAVFIAGLFSGWLLTSVARAADRPVNELVAAAKAGQPAARVKAIDELGSMQNGAASAVGSLTELLKDASPEVRAHAAHALGQIGAASKLAAAPLSALLKDSNDVVRRQAIMALGAIRPGPQVMIPIFVDLMDDPDEGVRQRVLHAVSQAGAPAVPGLIEALKNEKAVYWACLVLREMGPVAKDAIPALAGLLKNPRPEVRREAVLALGSMRADAVPALDQIGALLKDADAQEAATYALGQIGFVRGSADSTLRENAKQSDKLIGVLSLWTLARVHPNETALVKDAVEQLITRLSDKDPFIRTGAAKALATLKADPKVTFPIFERILENADDETLRLALDSLADQGSRAVPRLIYALKREPLRLHAIYILRRLGPDGAALA
jgi:HEAT repeat protein